VEETLTEAVCGCVAPGDGFCDGVDERDAGVDDAGQEERRVRGEPP